MPGGEAEACGPPEASRASSSGATDCASAGVAASISESMVVARSPVRPGIVFDILVVPLDAAADLRPATAVAFTQAIVFSR
jgi:hypothetical protein